MPSNISVLIPAYGPSPYIQFTLQSILDNSLRPDEILVIDDGLTEEAKSLINSFAKSLPVKILPNRAKGLVEALNTGISLAKGTYIARIDNDDCMVRNRLERQLMQMESDLRIVAVGSQCIYINSEGVKTGRSNYPTGELNNSPGFKYKCLIAHPSTLFRRSTALLVGGYRSVFTWDGADIAEDFDFWLRLSQEGIIFVSDELLTEYRQHSAQLSYTHLAGQLVGAPYISAVNLSGIKNPQKIKFVGAASKETRIVLTAIRLNLGIKKYLVCRLRLYLLRGMGLASNQVFRAAISKFISVQ